MRGAVSYIANRCSLANNEYMKNDNEKAPPKYIMYLGVNNVNNLYGQYLPTGGFRWMTKRQINQLDLAKYTEASKKGLILEVDFEYPQELRNLRNDYPLAAEQTKVNENIHAIRLL